jgi:hypothetical protein
LLNCYYANELKRVIHSKIWFSKWEKAKKRKKGLKNGVDEKKRGKNRSRNKDEEDMHNLFRMSENNIGLILLM